VLCLALPLAAVACSNEVASEDDPSRSASFAEMVNHVKDPVPLTFEKTQSGKMDRRNRVYGFTFEAKAGAVIDVAIDARAGSDAQGLAKGAPLDTIAAVYGPMKDADKGEKLSLVDDSGESAQARLPSITLKQDGKYLVVLGSWDDPGGDGSYSVTASCKGTEFQCRRPVTNTNCTPGTRYIQGGTVIQTETWNDCDIVLLEEVHVAPGAVLTIKPGVTVKGNFIGTGAYGNVALVVDGTLQAVGTKEHPVVFTALTTGWQGIVLKGASSSLENVFIEKAQRGVVVAGSNTTIKSANINSGELGIRFDANAKDNKLELVKISQVTNGISIGQGASVTMDDSVFLGKGGGTGIEAVSSDLSLFRRALVAGFADAMKLDTATVEVYDGTITKNQRGVTITGPQSGVHPTGYTCPPVIQASPPVIPPPPVVTTWRRDPVFIRCDLTKNKEFAVKLLAPELLVMEESNVKENGAGIVIEADALHQDSRIIKSNIYANGTAQQVDTLHTSGKLNISGNYWAKISDPELSASWLATHTRPVTCTAGGTCNTANCGSSYTCANNQYLGGGQYQYWNCSATTNATWTGQLTFTGFSPTELPAGPRKDDLCDLVKEERSAQAQ
jgi:hypothetical protein